MPIDRLISLLKMGSFVAASLLVSCQSTSAVPQPAVLEKANNETVARLKTAIAAAMDKGRVDFGAVDLENAPQIPVLPPRAGPFEGQSLALPTYFDLAIEGGSCVVVRRSTGEAFSVPNISCKLLEN